LRGVEAMILMPDDVVAMVELTSTAPIDSKKIKEFKTNNKQLS
jgi:hypothetical protein